MANKISENVNICSSFNAAHGLIGYILVKHLIKLIVERGRETERETEGERERKRGRKREGKSKEGLSS